MVPDVVDLTRELIGFDTMNPPGGELDCLERLKELFTSGGYSVRIEEFAPGRHNLIARLHPGASLPPLCFGGHIDTVPLGKAEWSVNPFAGEVRDGQVFGRGATDMKGGIAAMTTAALTAAPFLGPDQDILIHVYGGEETGCQGSLQVMEDMAKAPGAVIITEPTNNRPLAGHRGALWIELSTQGKTAHGSMPEFGENALDKLLPTARRLSEHAFSVPGHEFLGRPTMALTTMHAGLNVNSIPDGAKLTLDIRTIPDFDGEAVMADLQPLLDPCVKMRRIMDLPSVWTSPDDPWVRRTKELLARRMPDAPGVEIVEFFTDASAFRKKGMDVPIIILGPGDPHIAHQTDEHCSVAQLRTAMDMYLDVISDWYAIGREALDEKP